MWAPEVNKDAGPVYLAIADALAADIKAGRLADGTRLPPQRTLAEALGIDFTTVTRAYKEATKRGLVEGRVGQGTFVRSRPLPAAASGRGGLVDMSMNLPPAVQDPALIERMWRGFEALRQEGGAELLMRYQEPGGSIRDRSAGTVWLEDRLGSLDPRRVLVAPGAQGALTALTATLATPGDTILVEALSYPGFLTLAAHLRIKLVPVAGDQHGISPEALEKACEEFSPKALYCTPTLHNPTTITWSAARRKEVIAIAKRRDLPMIEDDAYGPLPSKSAVTLATLAPELVYHVASLSKCVAPALRVAYLVVPDTRAALRLAGALRATTAMASPLTAALATRWIEEGVAQAVLDSIREDSRNRQMIARSILPAGSYAADADGFHVWLSLLSNWTRAEFISRLRTLGIAAVASDAFAVSSPPEAIRLGLGAARSTEDLSRSLQAVAALFLEGPAMSSLVV